MFEREQELQANLLVCRVVRPGCIARCDSMPRYGMPRVNAHTANTHTQGRSGVSGGREGAERLVV